MIRIWLGGMWRWRAGRLVAVAAGVAVAVALLASLGAFLASSKGSMTARALRDVAVDWQVAVQPGTDPGAVLGALRAAPGVRAAVPVGFAQLTGMSATTGATTQTTGPGVALGLPSGYRSHFPDEARTLTGADQGVLLAQQTTANLHAKPGDVVRLGRAGMAPVTVRVDGVVDLPQANSLFQKVGAPPGAQPLAPPDNVVLLPAAQWHAQFAPLAAARPDLVSTQIHVARAHRLPADPAAAYTAATTAANHLEAQAAGGAVVGDNLAAALDAARSDASYAQVLFLFLGLPGAVLAGLLAGAVTATGHPRRRREQALMRLRGASSRQLMRLAAVEAGITGIVGSVAGLALAALVGLPAFGSVRFGVDPAGTVAWAGAAAGVGLAIAAAGVLAPAWRELRGSTVVAGRATVRRVRTPWWARCGLDVMLLVAAGIVFWLSSRNGYQLVLAPEGVPTISISYWALAGPALLWVGAGLLAWRLTELLLGRGHRLVGRALRPLAGGLHQVAASMMARRRRPLANSIVLLALGLAFAASTAIFNATYRAQAEVDALLTNGADVTVTESPGARVGPAAASPIAAVPGVRTVEPLQHRFAYIGADLQDLYGVRPAAITGATALQDTYFQGGRAQDLMASLAARPDSILVSAETVKDYRLQPGALINLRIQDSVTNQLKTVPFHYIGIVKEFPTAPNDSFFVANASYVAQLTGSHAVGTFLVDTGGQHTTAIARRIQAMLGTSAHVTDVAHTRSTVGSSLTAVDLAGLTRVELAFALVLAAAAGGLVLGLGLAERRRTFAITTALGATPGQLRGILAAETAILTVGGLTLGAALSWVLSHMLVAVLTGVFDPPPPGVTIPWGYLGTASLITVAALGSAAAAVALRQRRRPAVRVMREL